MTFSRRGIYRESAAEAIVDRYVEHMRARNLRPQTIYNRRCALARLRRWAGSPILYLTETDLRRWQAQRVREIAAEPRRTELSHVRQFYAWATREGFLYSDPTARLELPRASRRLPRPIRDEALARAIANADEVMAAILGLAAFAGLRACEIAQLDWAEVSDDQAQPRLRVLDGKGGRGRVVPVSAALAALLEEVPGPRRGPVIRRIDGLPGTNKAHRISARSNEYLHSVGIEETLHQLRHRFASTAYQACTDIRTVQELLGHASPTTTAIYTEAASGVARQAVEAAGLLAA